MPTKEELDKTKKAEEQNEGINALTKLVESLPADIQKGFTSALADVQAQQNAAIKAAADAKPVVDDDPDDKDFDIDRASRGDFADWMSRRLVREVNKVLKPLSEQIEKTSDDNSRSQLVREIDTVRAAHSDFNDWKPEMGVLHKQNPALSVQDLYDLAKVRNPDKVAEFEKTAKEEKDKIEQKTDPFGGLMPTNTTGNEEEAKQDMTRDEASTAAWDSVMSEVPKEALDAFLAT